MFDFLLSGIPELLPHFESAHLTALLLTVILGFIIIFPLTRRVLLNKFIKKFEIRKKEKNNFIDGEFEDIEDDNDKKI